MFWVRQNLTKRHRWQKVVERHNRSGGEGRQHIKKKVHFWFPLSSYSITTGYLFFYLDSHFCSSIFNIEIIVIEKLVLAKTVVRINLKRKLYRLPQQICCRRRKATFWYVSIQYSTIHVKRTGNLFTKNNSATLRQVK